MHNAERFDYKINFVDSINVNVKWCLQIFYFYLWLVQLTITNRLFMMQL